MTTPDDERDDALDGDDELARVYREAAREPAPSELDAPILQAAHEAVARPRRRWRQPVAAAASVLLCLGLVLALPMRMPWYQEQANGGSSSANDAESARPTAAASSDAKATPQDRSQKAVNKAPAREGRVEVDEGAADSAAPDAEREPAFTASDDARPSASADVSAAQSEERGGDGATAAAPRAEASKAAPESRSHRRSPEAWLEHVRSLVDDDKREAAAEALRAFCRQYPDRDLPEELRTILATDDAG